MKRNDFNTDVWERLEAHLNARLEAMRSRLETDMDAIGTAVTRGRIREIKELLALPNKAALAKGTAPLSEQSGGDAAEY